MHKCKYFEIHELVPPKVFVQRGEKAWELLDDRLLITLDRLRVRYGSMTVNNYFWGGDRKWSGLRTPDSPYYREFSQHSFGRAADCIFKNYTADHIQKEIQKRCKFDTNLEHINSIELGVTWVHFDVRNCKQLKTYYPNK